MRASLVVFAISIAASSITVACGDGGGPALDASADVTGDVSSDSTLPPADAGSGDADARPTTDASAEAAPPPPSCPVIGDASFPDAYYPSVNVACTKPGDPCALPPNECVFDVYRVRYTKGYCSSSLTCIFTYVREECSGNNPGCDAGVCTCI